MTLHATCEHDPKQRTATLQLAAGLFFLLSRRAFRYRLVSCFISAFRPVFAQDFNSCEKSKPANNKAKILHVWRKRCTTTYWTSFSPCFVHWSMSYADDLLPLLHIVRIPAISLRIDFTEKHEIPFQSNVWPARVLSKIMPRSGS
eukprot:6181660-Pleurochrysis_carterae.AAC.1